MARKLSNERSKSRGSSAKSCVRRQAPLFVTFVTPHECTPVCSFKNSNAPLAILVLPIDLRSMSIRLCTVDDFFVPKRYAAGLEMRLPGGACLNWALKSPASNSQQEGCQVSIKGWGGRDAGPIIARCCAASSPANEPSVDECQHDRDPVAPWLRTLGPCFRSASRPPGNRFRSRESASLPWPAPGTRQLTPNPLQRSRARRGQAVPSRRGDRQMAKPAHVVRSRCAPDCLKAYG